MVKTGGAGENTGGDVENMVIGELGGDENTSPGLGYRVSS